MGYEPLYPILKTFKVVTIQYYTLPISIIIALEPVLLQTIIYIGEVFNVSFTHLVHTCGMRKMCAFEPIPFQFKSIFNVEIFYPKLMLLHAVWACKSARLSRLSLSRNESLNYVNWKRY